MGRGRFLRGKDLNVLLEHAGIKPEPMVAQGLDVSGAGKEIATITLRSTLAIKCSMAG